VGCAADPAPIERVAIRAARRGEPVVGLRAFAAEVLTPTG